MKTHTNLPRNRRRAATLAAALFTMMLLATTPAFSQSSGFNGSIILSGPTLIGPNPNCPSALVDMDAPDKGLLIPRVKLLQTTNGILPILTPCPSMVVYNTNTTNTGTNDVTPGFYFWNTVPITPVWERFVTGGGNDWLITGNTNTIGTPSPGGTNFLGTINFEPLNFRVNNQQAGRIDYKLENAFYGYEAGYSNFSGRANTAMGDSALFKNQTTTQNVAVGRQALFSLIAAGPLLNADNVGVGFQALYSDVSGINNTAVGSRALASNTVSFSTAVGGLALTANTTGQNNTATGYTALATNSTGNYNTANGNAALFKNTTGSSNTATGDSALWANTAGVANTATGVQALRDNTTANFNTADGLMALMSNKTGHDNTAIGDETLKQNISGN